MKNDASVLIEQYLLGELDMQERQDVENRAETDREFAQELQFQKDIILGVHAYGDARLRERMAALDQRLAQGGFFDSGNAAPQNPRLRFFSGLKPLRWVAAAIGLLAVVAYWWMRSPTTSTMPENGKTIQPVATIPVQDSPATTEAPAPGEARPQPATRPPENKYLAMARGYWKAPDFSNVRSDQAATRTILSIAVEAFQKQQYTDVINRTESVPSDDPNYWPVSELYAHACFLTGRTAKATARFSLISESGQLPYSERADWYLLLCRLAGLPGSRVEYDAALNKILADNGHPFYEQAQKLAAAVGQPK